MKNTTLLILLFSILSINTYSQFDKKVIKIGLFTPLYLDKSFDSTGRNLINPDEFPRQAISGLELYEGAYLAVDSINRNGIRVKMKVFDTQSKSGNINNCIENGEFEDLDIIFCHGSLNEIQQLSVIANEYKLPFININIPNNKVITNCPFTYVANPSIETHMEFLVNQINKRWPREKILWIKRNSLTDEILEQTFDSKNLLSGLSIINKKSIEVTSQFKWNSIASEIDTTKSNIFIIGSLDNTFTTNFLNTFATFPKKGLIQIIGMPNIEQLREVEQSKFGTLPIFYSSPIFVSTNNNWAKSFNNYLKSNTYSTPSLSAYKGFELVYYFTSIYSKYGRIELENEEDNLFKVMDNFQFKEVRSSSDTSKINFFENKGLYFIRKLNGINSINF